MADKFDLFEQGAKIYDAIPRGQNEDLEAWSKANRQKLLAAYSYMERGIKAINDPTMNGVLYGILSMVAFDLLELEKAEKFAVVALETEEQDWNARFTLYQIRLNQYIWADQRRVGSMFGGLVGAGLTAVSWASRGIDKNQKKEALLKAVDSLLVSFRSNHGTLPDDAEARNGAVIEVLGRADLLLGIGLRLQELGFSPIASWQTVVDVLSSYPNCGEHENLVREVEAVASGNLLML